jgi:hypothetical protein
MTIDGEDMSPLVAVEEHYSTGLTRANIERALIGAGKDPKALEPADLATLEDECDKIEVRAALPPVAGASTSGSRL